MNKRAILILTALVLFFGAAYITTLKFDEQKKENILADRIEIQENEVEIIKNETVLSANTEETKTTPNTELVLKKIYKDCGHSKIESATLPEEMVNLNREELAEKYKTWEIEKFAKEEVILAREVSSFCGEHFLVIEENGIVSIYNLDEAGNRSLKEVSEIAYEYLPETDKIILKNRNLCI
ncbi:MAG: hypothetical protein HFJ51_03470 [Clostridia bacterium]|nr:hypothetical protein [Clostridia bacterium]